MISLSHKKDLWIILLFAILIRILFHFSYTPWWTGDSGGYLGWSAIFSIHYDGGRTPGYPLFVNLISIISHLPLLKGDRITPLLAEWITITQSFLGIISVFLFYHILALLKLPKAWRFFATLTFAVLTPVVKYEMLILSESLSVFVVLLSVDLLICSVYSSINGTAKYTYSILAGCCCGFSVLVRPNNLIFYLSTLCSLFFFTIFCYALNKKTFRNSLLKSYLTLLLISAIPIIILMSFNYINTGKFMLTPMTYITRTFTAYNLFGNTKPQDQLLGNIMNKYYLLTNKNGVVKRDYLWQAFPEIRKFAKQMPFKVPTTSQNNFYCPQFYNEGIFLYIYLSKVSNALLISHPKIWLTNAMSNFRDTFTFYENFIPAANATDPISAQGSSVILNLKGAILIDLIAKFEAIFLLACYLFTFLSIFITGLQCIQTKKTNGVNQFLLCAIAIGTIATFIAPCFLAAYYSRFGTPFYSLLIICTTYVLNLINYRSHFN